MRGRRILALAALSLAASSCAGRTGPAKVSPTTSQAGAGAPAQEARPTGRAQSTVAEATRESVAIYERPGAPSPKMRLRHPQESGAPLVFLVRREQPDWLEVLLPVRPNGSTGWIRTRDVSLSHHDYRIVVELSAHRITVYKGAEVFLQEPVGVGKGNTPTPGGSYYTKELLQPPDPNTVYGPYAYGLSGFSNVFSRFGKGEGVIGIHGNNDPSALGKDVSAGCIRMSNSGITKLAKTLPLGVPVEIRP